MVKLYTPHLYRLTPMLALAHAFICTHWDWVSEICSKSAALSSCIDLAPAPVATCLLVLLIVLASCLLLLACPHIWPVPVCSFPSTKIWCMLFLHTTNTRTWRAIAFILHLHVVELELVNLSYAWPGFNIWEIKKKKTFGAPKFRNRSPDEKLEILSNFAKNLVQILCRITTCKLEIVGPKYWIERQRN